MYGVGHTPQISGEILALRWKNVDLDRGMLRVTESLEQTKAGIRFKAPKTDRTRAITLPAFAVAELRRLKRQQAEALLRLGVRQSGEALVCCREDGEPKQPRSLTHEFAHVIGKLKDLPYVRFHDLRHSHATQLLSDGVHPKIAQELWATRQSPQQWTCIRMSPTQCRAMLRRGSTRPFDL